MKTYGKNRKKNYLVRYLFIDENSNIVSLRLERKRVRLKTINKYYREELK